MAKSLDQIVTELADREAIRALPVRYCDCVWRGDVEGIVNLFTEDGAFTMVGAKSESSNRGRAELLKTYKEGLSSLTRAPTSTTT